MPATRSSSTIPLAADRPSNLLAGYILKVSKARNKINAENKTAGRKGKKRRLKYIPQTSSITTCGGSFFLKIAAAFAVVRKLAVKKARKNKK